MPAHDFRIKLDAASDVVTEVSVEWGWSPASTRTCIRVEAVNSLDEVLSDVVVRDYPPDCQSMSFEQLVAVPEQPSLALGLMVLAALARRRR